MKPKSGWFVILIWFIHMGYAPARAEESRDSNYTLDIGKVVVTASRLEQEYRQSTQNISVVEAKQIKSSGATEVSQVLDLLPSVNIIDYGSYGSTKAVHTRGASSSQVITLLNGRVVNTPRDGETDHNQIPLNNIERIEVVRGPAASIYGANAVGGVINIITKSGKKDMETELSIRGGSFFTKTADFSNGWKIGPFDYFAAANLIESEGHRDNSDYEQQNYNLKLGYDINNDNRLTFESGYNTAEVGTPGRNSDVDLDDRQEQWKDYFCLTWEGACWRGSKALLKVYQNLDRLEFIESLSPVHNKTTNQAKVYGLDLQVSQTWFDIFRTSFGINGRQNLLNSSASAKHEYNSKAAYIETEFDLFKDVVLKGSARIDDYSNFGNKTSPSASFSWWLFDKIKTHGLIGKSFRAPTFNDLYWPREDWGVFGGVEGNPNLKPETAISKEIGIGSFLFGAIETDVTYFHNKFEDMIAWTMDNTLFWRPTNINKAVTKGVEANFNFQPAKALRLNLNYTRLTATDTITNKWLIYRPRHQYKGSINYDFTDRLSSYLSARYTSKRYPVDDNSRFIKGYFVLDTNLSYKAAKGAEFILTINNILDRDYAEEEDYPMPGTSVLTGVKLKF